MKSLAAKKEGKDMNEVMSFMNMLDALPGSHSYPRVKIANKYAKFM